MRRLKILFLLAALVFVTSAQQSCPVPGPARAASTDSIAPNPPSDMLLRPESATSLYLAWGYRDSTAIDNVGVTRFYVYRDGYMLRTVFALSTIDSLLSPDTEYSYFVRAADAAGNVSKPSVTVFFSTPSSN